MSQRLLFTIGHSTRTTAAFLALLQAWGIQKVVDVRRMPGSRRVAWFNQEVLGPGLAQAGIGYEHIPELGGRRRARRDSPNTAWRNAGFRGYADHMATPEFARGLRRLEALRRKQRVAILCAEAVPLRCHRSLIADAEVARGAPVRHSGPISRR